MATLSQAWASMGWLEIAMYVSANCSRGKHLSEERFFSPPQTVRKGEHCNSRPPYAGPSLRERRHIHVCVIGGVLRFGGVIPAAIPCVPAGAAHLRLNNIR